ncbi:UDP-GAL-4-epimerase [Paecilomyces variotii No. 5]|uniref:UDP-GAL-4-epimerase n=1 Tax=Byssochlamys spectabilis (strain No. 5 / NBRC 109023) TaxID=1356009 RepID=V5FHL5_BYSSN|nr:UDP-GAL-4-epimerase [Paecilomyces variotii No. 5]
MESPRQSEKSSPSEALSPIDLDTPATEISTLFDDILDNLLSGFPVDDQYILVTGGLGFIGSHTTLELLKAGYSVIVIDNLSNSYQDVFDRVQQLAFQFHERNGTEMPSLKMYRHDYRDTGALRELLDQYRLPSRWGSPKSKIGGVIHFAAHKAVEESIRNPLKYYANNVSGLIDFVETLGEYGIKTFIFSSSATVYGTLANSGVPLKEELCVHRQEFFKDDDGCEMVLQPGCAGITNPYGRTKWMCEAILADLAYSDPEWTIVALRYFNPIGCDESGKLGEDPKGIPTNLFPVIVKVMTGQSDKLHMFGTDWNTEDGTAIRDFIHVTDLARGHIAALNTASEGKLRDNFRTFNLGTGHGHSVLEVVSAMENVSSKRIPRAAASRRQGDVGSCVARAIRSHNELAWETKKTIVDACRDICNFLEVSGLAS